MRRQLRGHRVTEYVEGLRVLVGAATFVFSTVMPPATRPLNPVEQKIHQACSTSDKKMLGQREIDALVPDVNIRVAAINFLLSTGMLKMLQDGSKQISYKAVMKKEMEIKKEMGGDENMVLNHIQTSANEGIWTKHLKGKTELHQTVINRCLKSLEQKGLIKAVKSVKYPTRKIYMMSHLEPSVEVTGGPWYSENELDTEFIKMLASACLRFIQDKSYPKSSFSWENGAPSASAAPLFPISQSSSYPTSKMIHNWLQKSRLSEQELGVEHVEMLLDVLVYDGEIERLPAFGAGMWDMGAMDEDSEEEQKEKKRKKKAKEKVEEEERKKKARGKKRSRKNESSDEDSEEGIRKKKKRRRVKEESDDSEEGVNKRKKSKKDESDSGDDSESENDKKKSKRGKRSSSKSKLKSKSKSKRRSPSSSDSDSHSESESSDSSSTSRKKKKKRSSSKSSTKTKSKSTFDADSDESDPEGMVSVGGMGSANVYRAVRQERVSLGWSQAPCGRCPVFDFCHENGPVNPRDCNYYGDWLQQGVADF